MAKWKSVLKTKEVKNADGSIATQGETVWVPLNDAAKASKVVEKAIQKGVYTPSSPDELEVMKKKLKDIEVGDLKRKGLIPRDAK